MAYRRLTATLLLALLCLAATAARDDRHADRTPLWQRSGRDLLWGFVNMYNPRVVHRPGQPYPYLMWFFGWAAADENPGYPGCDAIFHARSQDLEHWQVYAGPGRWDTTMNPRRWVPVITAGNAPYDQWHNGDPSVVWHEGRYYMAFSATGFDRDGLPAHHPEDTDGWLCCVMGATSSDGIHWTKTGMPIAIWPHDPGRREDYGPDYYGDYERPSLLRDGGRWRLWFDYWCPGRGVSLGYAENRDDFMDPDRWQVLRAGKSPLLAEWPNPSVIRVGSRYYSFADPSSYPHGGGHPWRTRQIYEAVSTDGLHWQVLGYIRPDADTPACHVPEPVVLSREGHTWLYLFYACQVGGDPYNWRYNRIRCMRRQISSR